MNASMVSTGRSWARRIFPAVVAGGLLLVVILGAASRGESQAEEKPLFAVSDEIGDKRLLTRHLDQAQVDAGRLPLGALIAHGKFLFDTSFTEVDGRGRPNHNGTFPALSRNPRSAPENFNRISAPDADSCAGCHNKPRSGGGGDNVANVFVMAQRFSFFGDPSQQDENGLPAPGSLQGAGNERNSLGMFGSGAIEMLAREMTVELHAIREEAKRRAARTGGSVTLPLVAKDIQFGAITALADGTVVTDGVQGVNRDLVIRPFHQKGVVVSLREFTNNAFPHHHGLQPVERFGVNTDTDGDGIANELSVGDITAATLYQASLGVPGQVIPRNERIAGAIRHGESVFRKIGCAGCHRPELELDSAYFTEPNPFNPPFNLRPGDVSRPFRFDLTRQGELPRLQRGRSGKVIVRAFTDLKRHNMGDNPLIHNERVVQGGVPTNVFITKKLWGFASEPHFLHNGCATNISTAILVHGGEAQAARDNFAALPDRERRTVIEFLKSLQVLPAGTQSDIADEFGRPRHR